MTTAADPKPAAEREGLSVLFVAIELAITKAPVSDLPSLQGELARLSAVVTVRLLQTSAQRPAAVEPEDRLLNVEEAAARLGQTKDWLYQHAHRYPFTRKEGGTLRFSNNEISAWIRKGAR